MVEETKEPEVNTVAGGQNERLVMREYSQGVCQDGAAILCNGEQLRIEQILNRLRVLEDVRVMVYDAPELNMNNFDDADVSRLNDSVCEIWQAIEMDA